MRKLLSLIIITITALGQSQTNEIISCAEICFNFNVKNPEHVGVEELCRSMQNYDNCLCECRDPSTDTSHSLTRGTYNSLLLILERFNKSTVKCEYSKCDGVCSCGHLMNPRNMSNEELCRASEDFVNCMHIQCNKIGLSPSMDHILQLILGKLENSNFRCDVKI